MHANGNWRQGLQSFCWVAILCGLLGNSCLVSAQEVDPKKEGAKKSSPKAEAAYADAAKFQNMKLYDIAIEDWQRFLTKFPDDPLASKAQHYLGICHLELKQFAKAAAAFELVLKNHPDFENLEQTYLNLGWCQYSLALVEKKADQRSKLFQQAAARFLDQVKKYPAGKLADQALFFRGESLYHTGQKNLAATAFAALVKSYPKSKLRSDALYSLGVAREELDQFAKAGEAYDLFLADYKEHDLVNEVRMRKAETVLRGGKFQEAAKLFAEVAAIEKFESADYSLYRQAFCLTSLKQLAEAGKLYASLVESYPKSEYADSATLSAGRCFYRAQQFKVAQTWFSKLLSKGGDPANEATHWIARIHLRSGAAAEALALVEKKLPAAAKSRFYVNLKMDQADAYYELPEKRAAALAAYVAIANDHPDSPQASQALYNGAFTALDLKQYQPALDHAASFQKKFPEDTLLADVKYISAEAQLQLRQLPAAEKQYRELVEGYAQHRQILVWKLRLAVVLYAQQKYPQTVDWTEKLVGQLKQPAAVAEAQFLLGASQFSQDKYPAAITALQAALAADARWRQADETLLFLSRAQHKSQQVPAATGTVQKLIKDFPKSRVLDQAYYRLGEYLYAADQYPEAIAEYQRVITEWPKSVFVPYALYGQGWSHLKTRQFDPAVKSFSSLVDGYAKHQLVAPGLLGRAMCYRQAKKYQQAIDDVVAFLELNPSETDKLDGFYERGLAEVALKQHAAATKSFEALLAAKAEFANTDTVLYELAWAYRSLEKMDRSTDIFNRLAKEYPNSSFIADTCFRLGEDQYQQKKYAAAIAQYQKAIGQKPTGELQENLLHKLGWAYYQQKKFTEALEQFNAQLKRSPQGRLFHDGTFMQAESLFKLKKYEEALPAFEKLRDVELSSPLFQVLTRLHAGQSAAQLKRWQESLAILETIPKEFAKSSYLSETHYEIGWAQHQLKKFDLALQAYEEAATESRTAVGARARFMMGEVEFEQKKFTQAIRHFQRVMYGFGGAEAAADVKSWQSKAALEAGRCCGVQAQGSKTATERKKWITNARKYYSYVLQSHPESGEAALAKKRLEALSSL
jgi:TolA-binding protein